MARFARVVVPGYPYHVTHRGNQREQIFSEPDDRSVYLAMLHQYAAQYGMDAWAYCLMTNHIHLLVVPHEPDSMANAIGRAHMRYARWYNRQQGWSGHLWANRYFSTVLDDEHLWHAVRYVEANPLRAKMVARAEVYEWSSCSAHTGIIEPHEVLSSNRPFPGHIGAAPWSNWINAGAATAIESAIRVNTTTGRPTGSPPYVEKLEELLNRQLNRQKVGRKCKPQAPDATSDLFEQLNA